MEKYKKYFTNFEKFKLKFDILNDIELQFNETLSQYQFKKIVDFYLENNTLQSVKFKRKIYYISTAFLNKQNLSVSDYFDKVNLEALDNPVNGLKVEYKPHLVANALIERKISELFE